MANRRGNCHSWQTIFKYKKFPTKAQKLERIRREQQNREMQAIVNREIAEANDVMQIDEDETSESENEESNAVENAENMENTGNNERIVSVNANQIAQQYVAEALEGQLEPTFFRQVAGLFPGSRINLQKTILCLQLYRQRHKVTDAAFEHLLYMLKDEMLPDGNQLPRTLYSFNKALKEQSTQQVIHREEDYIVYDIRPQLVEILQRNFASFIRHRTRIVEAPDSYDFCGDLMRKDFINYVSLALLTDGGALTKSCKMSVWPIIAQISDLPPVLQKSISNVVLLAIYVGDQIPDWHSIFKFINPQIAELKTDLGALRINGLRFKVRFLELLADNKAKAQILLMKEAPCFFGCPHCLIKGEREEGRIIYPHEAVVSQKRTNWIPIPDARDGWGNGIKDLSPISQFMELPTHVQIDLMHTTYSGTIQRLLMSMFQNKPGFFRNLFPEILCLKKPLEMKRNLCEKRSFNDINRLKTNELRMIAHYILPVILPNYADIDDDYRSKEYKQAVNMLLLCSALCVFASNNLTKDKIKFADRLLIAWHKTIPIGFVKTDWTYKAHLHLHYASAALKFGAPTSRTCFFMESCVGFIINKVTCPAAALKQIEERMRTIAAEELGELKEMFSTTRISPLCDSYQFSICHIPADFRQYFNLKFANMDIKCAKEVKKDYFRIRSRLFCDAHKPNDSFIYVYSSIDRSLLPAIAEVFFKTSSSENVFVLVRSIKIEMPFAKSLSWISGQQTVKELLTNQRSFPDIFILKPEFGQIGHIPMERVATKGLMVKSTRNDMTQRIIFPMGTFDHD